MNNLSKALGCEEKALQICRRELPVGNFQFGKLYRNIGLIHQVMNNFEEALIYYDKALVIYGKNKSYDESGIASIYEYIGMMHFDKGDYVKAISFYEEAIKIEEKSVLTSIDLARFYKDIGSVYDEINEYSMALSYFEKALKTQEENKLVNLALKGSIYHNIGLTYFHAAKLWEGHCNMLKAIEIREKMFPSDCFYLGVSYMIMGLICF